MAKRSGFHHVAMNIKNLKETIRFYEAFGCTLVRTWPAENPTCAMIDAGGTVFEVFEGREFDPEAAASFPHIALRSEDVDAEIEIARSIGAEVTTEPKDVVIGSVPPLPARIAFVKGPSGESVEFFCEK